jgi:hypothetical protein
MRPMAAPTKFAYDVFLSHTSKDKERVRRLAERLRGAGLRVWFDEEAIRSGDDIYLAIGHGVGGARTLVLCLAPARHLEFWVNQPVDVYLVIRDADHAIRRMNVTQYLKTRGDQQSRQIVFDGEKLDAPAAWRMRDAVMAR